MLIEWQVHSHTFNEPSPVKETSSHPTKFQRADDRAEPCNSNLR
jgi:hypothetical protein